MTILTKKETAAQLKVSLNTLSTLITTGKIAHIKLSDRRIGVAQTDIDAYINARRVGVLQSDIKHLENCHETATAR